MTYSLIGILSIVIQLIINIDIFRKSDDARVPAAHFYRMFLTGVILYHGVDVLWGIFYEYRTVTFLYADTILLFGTMALAVLLWTVFVVHYLEESKRFGKFLTFVGWGMFAALLVVLVINFFEPILFSLDAGEYHVGVARYAVLVIQIMLFLMTSVYTFAAMTRSEGGVKRRYRAVALFGVTMILALAAQHFFPLLPMYSIGYLVGCCMLHTFVVEDEKAEFLRALVEAKRGEAEKQKELEAARRLANTDPLTGVKSKIAYIDAEQSMDARIAGDEGLRFAVAVFDLNNLKTINDTQGHEAGNAYIIAACQFMCDTFKRSPVYRIGGDEFVVILEGRDYESRNELMSGIQQKMDENLFVPNAIVFSYGIADYEPGHDIRYSDVFTRADERMYVCKWLLKERAALEREKREKEGNSAQQ